MPANLFNRINLDLLYPEFLSKVLEVAAACQARGAEYFATFGLRSFDEQAALYKAYQAGTGGRAAPPGESAHNYGIAVDFTFNADPTSDVLNKPDWKAPEYQILGEEAQRAGLVWGGDFSGQPDCPHVQWPGFVTASQLQPLRLIYCRTTPQLLAAQLKGVWAYLDKNPPAGLVMATPGLPAAPQSAPDASDDASAVPSALDLLKANSQQ